MTGPEVDLLQGLLAAQVDPAGAHEAHGPLDLPGDGVVAPAFAAGGHELLVPGVHLGEVGEAALGEGPEQVQRGGGLVVGGEQAGGIRRAGSQRRHVVIDDVAPETRHLRPAGDLGGRGAGLGELPGDASQLDDRHARAVGENHGHLQDDLELVPDRVGAEVGETLGAVAGMEEKGLARRDVRQCPAQVSCFAGEDERRQRRQRLQGGLQGAGVGPVRLLGSRALPPAGRSPFHVTRVAHHRRCRQRGSAQVGRRKAIS